MNKEIMSSLCQENPVQSPILQSTVLPIDATSKTLSRMASIRRSLIPMDFFSRKKKKDQRRNTIAECEAKSVNDTTPSIRLISTTIISGPRPNISNGITNVPNHVQTCVTINHVPLPDTTSEENNNTKDLKNSSLVDNLMPDTELLINSNEQTCDNEIQHSRTIGDATGSYLCLEQKAARTGTEKKRKKSKSHLPISTSSAAIAIAVKMRQTFDKESDEKDDGRSSSGNWSGSSSTGRDSSDSEDTKSQVIGTGQISSDSLLTKNDLMRLTEDLKIRESLQNSDYRPSSAGTSTEPKTSISSDGVDSSFSMHTSLSEKECPDSKNSEYSFESDDELDNENLLQYSSGLSFSCESLNSLLSRTGGNELSTSTDTLLSEYSRIPLPQPPIQFSDQDSNKNIQLNKLAFIPQPLDYSPRKKSIYREPGNTSMKNTHRKNSKNEDSKASKISHILQKKFKLKENSQARNNKYDKRKYDRIDNQRPINMYSEDAATAGTVRTVIHDSKNTTENTEVKLNTFRPNVDISSENGAMNTFPSQFNSRLIPNHKKSQQSGASRPPYNPIEYSQTLPMSYKIEDNIPTKYSHQITVMPQKQTDQQYYDMNYPYQILEYDQHMQCSMCQKCAESYRSSTMCNSSYSSPTENQVSTYQGDYYYRPYYDQQNVAHVVLNDEGNVVYSTSSLDRRFHGKSAGSPSVQSDRMYSTLDTRYNGNHYIPNPGYYADFPQPNVPIHVKESPVNEKILETKLLADNTVHTCFHNCESLSNFADNQNSQEQIPIATSLQSFSNQNSYNQIPQYESSVYRDNLNTFNGNADFNQIPEDFQCFESNKSLPSQRKEPIGAQSPRDDSKMTCFPSNTFTTNSKSPKSICTINKLQSSTSMTTDDLFAIIHDSKKRLNIKTDSDITMTPSSSGSLSPSFQSYVTKNGPAETGFLGHRNTFGQTNNIGDRRSWADFGTADRRSLAIDRLGPNKPTSLHEFKMLLSQTRSNQDATIHKKSAVEQLKVNTPSKGTSNSTEVSSSLQSSPVTPLPAYDFYNGHMTVPLKRNNRTKVGMQPRCIMYPPILEDCSEDAEATTCDKKKSIVLESSRSTNTEYTHHVIKNSDQNRKASWQYGNTSMWV